MTDIDKLVARAENALCVEETTTKHTYFNVFGEKIDEKTSTLATVYMFDKSKCKWVKGTLKGGTD